MSILFNARLDIDNCSYVDVGIWTIHGVVVDNTGNFIATNSQIGDIIYINDFMENKILRYKVTNVDPATTGAELYATVQWDMNPDDPVDPIIGEQGIIGTSSGNLRLITLTSGDVNYVDSSFLNSVRNYENFEIIDKTTSNIIPTKTYTALEDISAYKFVYLNDNDQIGLADMNNVNCADRIIGISLESKLAGENIKIQLDQKVKNPNWSFEKTGLTVFVGENGDFITAPNTSAKFIEEVGTIVDIDSIELKIEDSIIL